MGPAKAERAAAVMARDPLEIDQLGGPIDLVATPSVRDVQAAPSSVLGVDIGASGVIAMLSRAGDLLAVHDMPTLNDGPAGRRAVNAPLLAKLVYNAHATLAYVELVAARPGEGAVGAFGFGRSRGVKEGVLAAYAVPVTSTAPAAWKRALGLPAGRLGATDAARSEAIRRWPDKAGLFARAKDDGRADACLIALAGLMRAALQ